MESNLSPSLTVPLVMTTPSTPPFQRPLVTSAARASVFGKAGNLYRAFHCFQQLAQACRELGLGSDVSDLCRQKNKNQTHQSAMPTTCAAVR